MVISNCILRGIIMIIFKNINKLHRGSALFIMAIVVVALIGAISLGVSKVINLLSFFIAE